MDGILVDSSVILDVFSADPRWCHWSTSQLAHYDELGKLFINPIIYAEVSIGFKSIEALELALLEGGFEMLPLPKEALFLAGKAFLKYRRQKGSKSSTLPDFYIGAHAAIIKLPLLTRDTKRFKQYFPSVKLIAP